MSLLAAQGGPTSELSSDDLRETLHTALASLGDRRRVLAVPPDFTRRDSQAGLLTQFAYQFYGSRLTDVLPALGTHTPMSDQSIAAMFGNIPRTLFRDHNWRTDTRKLGEIPSSFLREQSEGKLD